jgi:hypothetical protein
VLVNVLDSTVSGVCVAQRSSQLQNCVTLYPNVLLRPVVHTQALTYVIQTFAELQDSSSIDFFPLVNIHEFVYSIEIHYLSVQIHHLLYNVYARMYA